MRWLVLFCLAAGCGRWGFEDARIGLGGPDAAGDAGAADPDALAADGTLPPGTFSYVATIAECVDPQIPSLTSCETLNGAQQLVVDGNDGTTNDPWEAYVRFDLDTAIAGRTITSITLVVTATDDPKANGPDSGEVWLVAPFTSASLATTTPTKIGGVPIAPSRGSVDQLDIITFSLPVDVATAGAPLCLGIITTDQSGGVNYWNTDGIDPPKLVIDVQ